MLQTYSIPNLVKLFGLFAVLFSTNIGEITMIKTYVAH